MSIRCKTQWDCGDPVRRQKQMKRPLQWTKQPFKCRRKETTKIKRDSKWNVHSIARPIRPCSKHDWHPAVRTAYTFNLGDAFCLEEKMHFKLGYLPKRHQIAAACHGKSSSNITKYWACNKTQPSLLFQFFVISTLLCIVYALCNSEVSWQNFLWSYISICQCVNALKTRSLPVHPVWGFWIISWNLTPPSSCKALYFCCSGARAAVTASFMGSFRRTSQLSDCTWSHRGARAPSSWAMTASQLNTHWMYQVASYNHDHHKSRLVTMEMIRISWSHANN